MKTIWKFECKVEDRFTLEMPEGARILSLQTQGQVPCLWALVDTDTPLEKRYFRLLGTGHPVDFSVPRHVFHGTFQLFGGSLVFHLFENIGEEF